MAKKKSSVGLLLLAGAGLLLLGGTASAADIPAGPFGPDPDPDPGPDPDPFGPPAPPAPPVPGPTVVVVPPLPPMVDPVTILGDWTRPTPTPGFLYQVRQGDTMISIARAALGVGAGSPQTVPYIKCITGSRWNWNLYATQASGGSYAAEREGVSGHIVAAVLPTGEPVAAAIASGRLPQRIVQWTPGPNGSIRSMTGPFAPLPGKTWGMLFLPVLPCPTVPMAGAEDGDHPSANPTALLLAMGSSNVDFRAGVGGGV